MLSVIIPCHEDDLLLYPTVKSIFSNKYCPDFEVMLICNEDFFISENVNQFPVKIYRGTFKNQAHALNWALKKASGDIICLTKPGCVVASNWLFEITKFLQDNPDVSGVGGPILPCLDYGTKIQKLASQIFSEEQAFPESIVILEFSKYQGLFHATNSAFRAEILSKMKFDEFFIYDYDFDICWRILYEGYRLAYHPKMIVRYIFPSNMISLLLRYYTWGKEKIALRKKHRLRISLMHLLYPIYNSAKSFLEPSSFISTKKLLRLYQHLAFNLGSIFGYCSLKKLRFEGGLYY